MGTKETENLGDQDWPPTPGETSATSPEGCPSLTSIERKEILGYPYRQQTLVGNIPNANNWQTSPMGTGGTVTKKRKAAVVVQRTPACRRHIENMEKQRSAPQPPGQ